MKREPKEEPKAEPKEEPKEESKQEPKEEPEGTGQEQRVTTAERKSYCQAKQKQEGEEQEIEQEKKNKQIGGREEGVAGGAWLVHTLAHTGRLCVCKASEMHVGRACSRHECTQFVYLHSYVPIQSHAPICE